MAAAAHPVRTRPGGGLRGRIARISDRWALIVYALLAVIYLLVPVAVIILFSFNDPPARSNFIWSGFTLKYWLNPLGVAGLPEAVGLSLVIAFLSTLISTALGTLVAIALERYRFRGRAPISALIFLPMATPEIIMGASLLTLFVSINAAPFFPLNFVTILIAHVMFNISYVVVTVRARLAGFPRHLEEAAADLYANEWTVFWKVTFPLILPGIVAGALLAFSLSIDDFVITNFSAGKTQTFPMYIYAKYRIGIPVQVNVIGTVIFLVAVGAVAITTIASRRSNRR
jgi:spermidine/putrescine transport system permease protein